MRCKSREAVVLVNLTSASGPFWPLTKGRGACLVGDSTCADQMEGTHGLGNLDAAGGHPRWAWLRSRRINGGTGLGQPPWWHLDIAGTGASANRGDVGCARGQRDRRCL